MRAGKLVCGLLAVSVLAVAFSLLLVRSAPPSIPQRDLTSEEQDVVAPPPRLPDPLEADRLDPKRLILYRQQDLRQREGQEVHERLLKAIGSRKFEPPPRRQWLQ